MNRKRIFATAFPTLLLAVCISRLKEPEFIEMKNFRVSQVGLKESEVKMDLVYYNPNRMNLEMKRGEIDIYIEGRFAGKSQLDTSIFIPREDTFSIPAKVKVDMKNAFPNALTLLLNDEVEVKLDGFVRVGKGLIFVNVPIHSTSRQKLNFLKAKSAADSSAEL